MQEYRVMASNLNATYTAGKYCANSAEEACNMARDDYRKSDLGRSMHDVGAFKFFTVDKFPHEQKAPDEND